MVIAKATGTTAVGRTMMARPRRAPAAAHLARPRTEVATSSARTSRNTSRLSASSAVSIFMAAILAITDGSLMAVRIVQSGLGAIACVLTAGIAARSFTPNAYLPTGVLDQRPRTTRRRPPSPVAVCARSAGRQERTSRRAAALTQRRKQSGVHRQPPKAHPDQSHLPTSLTSRPASLPDQSHFPTSLTSRPVSLPDKKHIPSVQRKGPEGL